MENTLGFYDGIEYYDGKYKCFFELSITLFKMSPNAFFCPKKHLKVFLGLETFLRNTSKQALRPVWSCFLKVFLGQKKIAFGNIFKNAFETSKKTFGVL